MPYGGDSTNQTKSSQIKSNHERLVFGVRRKLNRSKKNSGGRVENLQIQP